MLDCLVLMTEETLFTSVPIVFGKVVFSKNNSSTKIPRKFFVFQWNFHLPDFLIIIYRHFWLDECCIHGVHREFTAIA